MKCLVNLFLFVSMSCALVGCGGKSIPGTGVQTVGVTDAALQNRTLQEVQESWCGFGQWELENFDPNIFAPSSLETFIATTQEDFSKKPNVTNGTVNLHAYIANGLKGSLGYQQIWCKMKTPEGIANGGVILVPQQLPPKSCSVMNQKAIEWAIDHLTPEQRTILNAKGVTFDYLPDDEYERGDQWYTSNMMVQASTAYHFTLQANHLRTSMAVENPKTPDPIEALLILLFGGMNYCKLISPEGAVALVSQLATP